MLIFLLASRIILANNNSLNLNFGSKRGKSLISLALPPKMVDLERGKELKLRGLLEWIYISPCWELWPFIIMAWKSIILAIKLFWIFWLWNSTLMAIEILFILCWWCQVANRNCPLFWFIIENDTFTSAFARWNRSNITFPRSKRKGLQGAFEELMRLQA